MTEVFFVFGKGEARFLKELLSVRPEKALEEGAQKILIMFVSFERMTKFSAGEIEFFHMKNMAQ